jgi:Family of unknown function (DUF6516)
MVKIEETGLEYLLALNGDRYFIDDKGELEVIFKATRIRETTERPSGLIYSLVLLDANHERLVCFDNAHTVGHGSGPGKRRSIQFDHKHIGNKVTPYIFKDAFTLLKDFWSEVDKQI